MKKNDIYRMLPRVDTLMGDPLIGEMIRKYGYDCALYGVRSTLEKAREKLQDCASEEEVRQELDSLPCHKRHGHHSAYRAGTCASREEGASESGRHGRRIL